MPNENAIDGTELSHGVECPTCGTEMEKYVPTNWHCHECERDYWREADGWWSCDVDGVIRCV